MITYIKDSILNAHCRIIAHGVNCQNVMGSGVARVLFEKWPAVKYFYHDYFEEFHAGMDGKEFLGRIDDIPVDEERNGKIVVNCFTQQFFGNDGKCYLSYEALEDCMIELRELCIHLGVKEVAMPKIGAGLAGGNWAIIENIINEVLKDIDVYVYHL